MKENSYFLIVRLHLIPALKRYQDAAFGQGIQAAEGGAALHYLVRIDLLACTNFHIDKRTLPETVLDDRGAAVLDDELVTSRMQDKLLADAVDKP